MPDHADIDHTGLTGVGSGAPTDAAYLTTALHAGLSAEVVVRAPAANGNVPAIIRKAADEVVNGSSTLQNDDALLFALAASDVYEFELFLWYDSGTTPDLKIAFTVPAGATLRWSVMGQDAAAAVWNGSFVQTVSGTAMDLFGNGVGTIRFAHVRGFVANGATPGNLQLQWAQNTSNGSDSTVRANSTLRATKLA